MKGLLVYSVSVSTEALSDIIRTFHQTPPEGGLCRPTAHPISLKWRGLSAKETCCCPSSDLNH